MDAVEVGGLFEVEWEKKWREAVDIQTSRVVRAHLLKEVCQLEDSGCTVSYMLVKDSVMLTKSQIYAENRLH